MEDKFISALIVMCCFILILMFVFAAIANEMYNDYKCSKTTDIKYWQENNCMKYYERSRNDK